MMLHAPHDSYVGTGPRARSTVLPSTSIPTRHGTQHCRRHPYPPLHTHPVGAHAMPSRPGPHGVMTLLSYMLCIRLAVSATAAPHPAARTWLVMRRARAAYSSVDAFSSRNLRSGNAANTRVKRVMLKAILRWTPHAASRCSQRAHCSGTQRTGAALTMWLGTLQCSAHCPIGHGRPAKSGPCTRRMHAGWQPTRSNGAYLPPTIWCVQPCAGW